jgi:hypothetical protein
VSEIEESFFKDGTLVEIHVKTFLKIAGPKLATLNSLIMNGEP